MLHALAITLLVASAPSFDDTKKGAEEVESLRKAVSALVGDCSGADFESSFDCQENQKSAAAALRKKKHYIYFGAIEGGMLKYAGSKGNTARMVWTPIVDTKGGIALTVGRPSKLNNHGQAVVKNFVVDAEMAPGILDGDFQRAARVGMIAVEVVGSFGQPWKLSKGAKVVQGVEFKPSAIRFSNARTGKTLAEAQVK